MSKKIIKKRPIKRDWINPREDSFEFICPRNPSLYFCFSLSLSLPLSLPLSLKSSETQKTEVFCRITITAEIRPLHGLKDQSLLQKSFRGLHPNL